MGAGADQHPIAPDDAARLFTGLEDTHILVAVSGGADSTALLWLLARWAQAGRLTAATVDHELRATSGEEARSVAAFSQALGVPHAILPWRGHKPASGIEAAAREARYRLLEAHAADTGATHLVTAHTQDDQAETVLMRLAAGSGPSGLAAMRRCVRRRESLSHVRPFLDVPKARLVATLKAEGIGWHEDAMNADEAFARPRLRAAAAALAREGLTRDRLTVLARRMLRLDTAVEKTVSDAWVQLAAIDAAYITLSSGLFDLPEEIALRLLRRAIEAGGGQDVRLDRLERLFEALAEARREGRASARTLGTMKISLSGRGVAVTKAPPRRVYSRS